MFLYAVDKECKKTYIEDAIISNDYYCPECGERLILKKLGKIRRHHFAHKINNNCFEYKYDEMTQWHKDWQTRFPKDNREVIVIDELGKRCVADVLINNIEIEFQHSAMPYDVFMKRIGFYNKFGYHVIWIFDRREFCCLKYLKKIPDYLDIYIEEYVNLNIFVEEGLFLDHVKKIDENKGIIFDDTKYTVSEFVDMINNYNKEIIKIDEKYKENTLINIINDYPNANKLIVYNSKTKYSILLDRYNMNRFLQGKQLYGKYKKSSNYGSFNGFSEEIYYSRSKEPIWRYQIHY